MSDTRSDTRMDAQPDQPEIRIAVRVLAQVVHRQGGLAGPAYAGVQALEGMRLHQLLVRKLRETYGTEAVQDEYALQGRYQQQDLIMSIGGRCDALIHLPHEIRLIEAKSFTGPVGQLPEQGEPVHWAQAMLYACLLVDLEDPAVKAALAGKLLRVGLAYISAETEEILEMNRPTTPEELRSFFRNTCQAYASLATNILEWQKKRDQSAKVCEFPYPVLRQGQKFFMQQVLGAIRQKGVLFAQAPTGTGKTMSVLFPAVKALGHHLVDHIFYLTAMTSTRQVAVQALEDMRRKGLILRSLTLFAKEKLCLRPELYCDNRLCPLATHYYDHLPAALQSLFPIPAVGRQELLAAAEKHQVCPFELSLDLALYCDVIICDYNYAFDPRVRLERFFGNDQNNHHLLLVDEAHNLPSRAREMYSAVLDEAVLVKAARLIREQPEPILAHVMPVVRSLEKLIQMLQLLLPALNGEPEAPGFEVLEKDCRPAETMRAQAFIALRRKPAAILAQGGRTSFLLRQLLDDIREWPDRRPILDTFFMLLFFSRVAEEFYQDTSITTARLQPDRTVRLELMCMDAAPYLTACYAGHYPIVFFSATLTPMNYYIGLMDKQASLDPPDQLNLPSPFPTENLLVLICDRYSIKYKHRQESLFDVVNLILLAVRQRIGNYLVFLPSFAYLQQVRQILRMRQDLQDLDCLVQIPNMDEKLKKKYLNRFEKFGQRTLMALAVMGSLFNEGIDLGGERLSGVIIVGTGLPRLSPEREIMQQYYASLYGSGYEYSYVYPGFNKVQQAAGRVIRSEEDRGFVLLIDDRYSKPDYQQLFPAEWHPRILSETAEVGEAIRDFWQS